MPTIHLATPLVRFLPTSAAGRRTWNVLEAGTVRAALEAFLAEVPELRGYLLDERGALRHHIAAFVNGAVVRDKTSLQDAIAPDGELFLVPALSGG